MALASRCTPTRPKVVSSLSPAKLSSYIDRLAMTATKMYVLMTLARLVLRHEKRKNSITKVAARENITTARQSNGTKGVEGESDQRAVTLARHGENRRIWPL